MCKTSSKNFRGVTYHFVKGSNATFLPLSVIPDLKITDRGLVDVGRFELVPLALG